MFAFPANWYSLGAQTSSAEFTIRSTITTQCLAHSRHPLLNEQKCLADSQAHGPSRSLENGKRGLAQGCELGSHQGNGQRKRGN